MTNLQTHFLYQNLINIFNESGVPIGTAYYIVKSILLELKEGFQEAVSEEAKNINTFQKTEELDLSSLEEEKKEIKNET